MPEPENAPATWRPQHYFRHHLGGRQALDRLNAQGGIAVAFRPSGDAVPDLRIEGGQSRTMSLWLTHSASGFLSVPKLDADLVTVRFVTSGQMIWRDRRGERIAHPGRAMIVPFEAMRCAEASAHFAALSGTITRAALRAAHHALEGRDQTGEPALEALAPADTAPMRSLLMSLRQMHRRLGHIDQCDDLFFPLLEEIVSYQILSCWPRRGAEAGRAGSGASSAHVRTAVQFIHAHLGQALRLSDVAAAAGISVRMLQIAFKRELGLTPLGYVIEQRLLRVHADLRDEAEAGSTIADLARRWGFVHMSDFAQRYRRRFGCTPIETRRTRGLS